MGYYRLGREGERGREREKEKRKKKKKEKEGERGDARCVVWVDQNGWMWYRSNVIMAPPPPQR